MSSSRYPDLKSILYPSLPPFQASPPAKSTYEPKAESSHQQETPEIEAYCAGWSSVGVSKRVADLMVEEDFVTGVWSAILAHYFPFPTFVVSPEYWSFLGREYSSNLAVIHCKSEKTVFSFQGKSPNITDVEWEDSLHQLRKYLENDDSRIDGTSYGMLAQGTKCTMLQSIGTTLVQSVHQTLDTSGITRVCMNATAALLNEQFERILKRISDERLD